MVSLPSEEAAQWNQKVMIEMQAALEMDPAADLLSMLSKKYHDAHRLTQSEGLSELGKFNLETVYDLDNHLKLDPEADLSYTLPCYKRKRTWIAPDRHEPVSETPDFPERLDGAEDARIIFPVSDSVHSLLYGNENLPSTDTQHRKLLAGLRRVIWKSPRLWHCHFRGIVVKCSDNIVAKVVLGLRDYTEYTSMQFLARVASDVPAPRVHGLIKFGPCRVIFMDLVPGTTLTTAWPDLSTQQKTSIRQQLDAIFVRLRSIPKPPGQTLGNVLGGGAKEHRVNPLALFPGLTTAAQYRDLQFSAQKYLSKSYTEFLRSFLEAAEAQTPATKVVFTHGDLRTDNIMVEKIAGTDDVSITGVIDWEDSGFYPEYYKCMALARTMSRSEEDDWYLHLPDSISPLKYPSQWLVDRLCGVHMWNASLR